MRFDRAAVEERTSSCNGQRFVISSAGRRPSMIRPHPVLLGLLVTLAQLALAVGLMAPAGPLSFRYNTLVQHDALRVLRARADRAGVFALSAAISAFTSGGLDTGRVSGAG